MNRNQKLRELFSFLMPEEHFYGVFLNQTIEIM